MAFRPRNVALNRVVVPRQGTDNGAKAVPAFSQPGVKPSYLTSLSITSTGTAELDGLLGGHGGLILGSSLLIGEHGTTDYSGALLRAYAAEGLLQDHHVHVLAVGKAWTSNLPGVATEKDKKANVSSSDEKMKIAWRYENMERATPRGLPRAPSTATTIDTTTDVPFCHVFDLTKRLDQPPSQKLSHIMLSNEQDPLTSILLKLTAVIAADDKTIHRIVMPLLLSPLYYPPTVSPVQVLRFLHGLRALLKRHASQVTAMISIPLSLYPRSTGMVRWMEHLSDGALEMVPFPYIAGSGANKDDAAQGMLKVLKLPVATERGEGGAGAGNTIGDDLAFTLSRRKFVIEPFSLPPLEGDQEAQQDAGKITAKDVEF